MCGKFYQHLFASLADARVTLRSLQLDSGGIEPKLFHESLGPALIENSSLRVLRTRDVASLMDDYCLHTFFQQIALTKLEVLEM